MIKHIGIHARVQPVAGPRVDMNQDFGGEPSFGLAASVSVKLPSAAVPVLLPRSDTSIRPKGLDSMPRTSVARSAR